MYTVAMDSNNKVAIIKIFLNHLLKTFGKSLLYGYLHSLSTQYKDEERLYFILTDEADPLPARQGLNQIWAEHRVQLPNPPILINRSDFERYLQLFPGRAIHMAHNSKKIGPAPMLAEKVSVAPSSDQLHGWAYFQALHTSELIAPNGAISSDALHLLYSQLRQFNPDALNSGARHPRELVMQLMESLPEVEYTLTEEIGSPPESLPIPTLVSHYTNLDRQIFLVSNYQKGITETDWSAVWEHFPRQTEAFQISTPGRFREAIRTYGALDHKLMSFQKMWGADLLSDVNPTKAEILQDAARLPIKILVEEYLPKLIEVAPEEEADRIIIHDFQNRLLNIRLQNELLGKLGLAEKREPDMAIPSRDAPTHFRIRMVQNHLSWWSNYYFNEMLSHV